MTEIFVLMWLGDIAGSIAYVASGFLMVVCFGTIIMAVMAAIVAANDGEEASMDLVWRGM